MRKITREAMNAFYSAKNFSKANTRVETDSSKNMFLFLFNNLIAEELFGELFITTAGHSTVTTKERLNGLAGVSIYTKKGQMYLNDKPWNGEYTKVN